MTKETEPRRDAVSYMRKTVGHARAVMAEKHDLTQVRIRPVSNRRARFSIPVVVDGIRRGQSVRLFAKIIGSSDHFTAVISQFLKNAYLEMNGHPAIFDVAESALGMARYQYDRLLEMAQKGIPTSRPLGYHDLDGIRALLVLEFVTGEPFTKVEITNALAGAAFDVLWRMHKQGLHHGDLKLDNLILGPDGTVYLMDTGRFREGTPERERRAYDIASMLCVTKLFEQKEGFGTALLAALVGAIIYALAFLFLGSGLLAAVIAGLGWLIALAALYDMSGLRALAVAVVVWIVAAVVGWFVPTILGPL